MSSTDYFQNRTDSFEQTRRRLESPGERARVTGSISRAEVQSAQRAAQKASDADPAATVRSITWGSAVKISVAIYFALLGVLVTLAIATLLVLRFVLDSASVQVQDFGVEWQTLPSGQSSTAAPVG